MGKILRRTSDTHPRILTECLENSSRVKLWTNPGVKLSYIGNNVNSRNMKEALLEKAGSLFGLYFPAFPSSQIFCSVYVFAVV